MVFYFAIQLFCFLNKMRIPYHQSLFCNVYITLIKQHNQNIGSWFYSKKPVALSIHYEALNIPQLSVPSLSFLCNSRKLLGNWSILICDFVWHTILLSCCEFSPQASLHKARHQLVSRECVLLYQADQEDRGTTICIEHTHGYPHMSMSGCNGRLHGIMWLWPSKLHYTFKPRDLVWHSQHYLKPYPYLPFLLGRHPSGFYPGTATKPWPVSWVGIQADPMDYQHHPLIPGMTAWPIMGQTQC